MEKVYGYSDDNVCWNEGEIDCYCKDAILVFSDFTIIRVGYSKMNSGVWWIDVEHKGSANQKLSICTDENAEIYSDIFEIDASVVCTFRAEQKYPCGKPWEMD